MGPGPSRHMAKHPDLDLLPVVYVDDFKMAGPKDNLAKGWEGISKVLDMDPGPAEPLGRYFGCHHREKTAVKLDRGAHHFAYVLDKQKSAAAAKAGGNSEPNGMCACSRVFGFMFCMLATLHCTCSMQARSCLSCPAVGQKF